MAILFLTLEHVLAIHDVVLEEHGGMAGVRARELVESAVELPRAAFGGHELYPSLLDKAAAYLFFLASNHGFSDGNKRTALAAALTFLSINGEDVTVPENRWSEAEALVLAIAAGQLKRADATAHFTTFIASLARV